jgi:selenocysteine-specific elongation factor
VSVGDTIVVLPSGIKTKVRGIQVHNEKVEKATSGLRTAINLQGVEKALLERGNVITVPELLQPTMRVDCHLTCLASAAKSLKNGGRMRFHTGTMECESFITLLDRNELAPGEKAFVQLRFDQPVVVLPHDRFVIRSYSPLSTIGGGEILDPLPTKHKRLSPEVLESLRIIQSQNIEKIIEIYLLESKFNGKNIQELGARLGVHPKDLSVILQKMVKNGSIILFDQDTLRALSLSHYEGLKRITLKELKSYHENNPLKKGILKEELKSKLPWVV